MACLSRVHKLKSVKMTGIAQEWRDMLGRYRAAFTIAVGARIRRATLCHTSLNEGDDRMAGHSHAKNIMHRKGKSDAARSKVFSKLAREITVAAKMGVPDPSMNARLRLAVANARQWLAQRAPQWERRLAAEPGYETPPLPAVCEVREGRPYADARRNRLYIHRLASEDDRVALAHEYLHLAFARHPRGQDEDFVEAMARKLVRTQNP